LRLHERLSGLFFSPGVLMQNIKLYPKAWVPLLVCICISLASLPLIFRHSEIQQTEMSILCIEHFGVDYVNLGATLDDDGNIVSNLDGFLRFSTVLQALIAYPIYAFFAALALLILCKIMRSTGTLSHYFSLCAHVYIISAVCNVVIMGAAVAFDNALNILSLAAVVMPNGNLFNLGFCILSAINLPAIWTMALVTLGIKTINEWSATKAVIAGVVTFFAVVLTTAGILYSAYVSFSWAHQVLQMH
jgi:hypothetical protein